MHTYIFSYTHTFIHFHIHTYMDTYIHVYIYICIFICLDVYLSIYLFPQFRPIQSNLISSTRFSSTLSSLSICDSFSEVKGVTEIGVVPHQQEGKYYH